MFIIDYELYNFICMEWEMYDSILDETPDKSSFTPEFQEKVKMYIRKIIINTEQKFLHTEED